MITTRKAMYLNPQFIEKAGKKEFVVLPYEEYQAIEKMMEDYMDLIDVRETKAETQNQPSVPLDEVITMLKKRMNV
uniref:Antitoxin n=1 Tax=Chlorobium chlorochromatii (strain CaD3) TaxID=340177 RepID=Q3AQ91_CHLCH